MRIIMTVAGMGIVTAACSSNVDSSASTATVPLATTATVTVTTHGSATTAPAIDVSGEWVVHTIDGVFRDSGQQVWDTEPVLGENQIARDREGGLVWIDVEGLWWLTKGASRPRLVLDSSAVRAISGVVSTEIGPVVRVDEPHPMVFRYVALRTGENVADPGGWSYHPGEQTWTVGTISVRIAEPEVVWDAEGQPEKIIEPAHLIVTQNAQPVVDMRIGGLYQAWARIDDFDGRRLIVSRYVHEPALPTESFFVIDVSCPDCLRTFNAAATHAALSGVGGTPSDEPLTGAVQAPISGFLESNMLLTDDGIRDLEDGRYVIRIESFTEDRRWLWGDLMVWFSGEEANIAARIDGESELPVPNDFYIRNVDPSLLSLRLSASVAISSVWWDSQGGADLSSKPMTLDDLTAVFTTEPTGELLNLVYDPWWITVQDGVIVALAEQYVP